MIWIPQVFVLLILPAWVVYSIIRIFFIKNYKILVTTELVRLGLIAYLIFLIYIVWLDNAVVLNVLPYNIVPFKTILFYITDTLNGTLPLTIGVSNILGNIFLTLPLGVFLTLTYSKVKPPILIGVSILIPLIIEVGQLFMHLLAIGSRSIDIDDLILNCLGILAGYYVINTLPSVKKLFNKYTLKTN